MLPTRGCPSLTYLPLGRRNKPLTPAAAGPLPYDRKNKGPRDNASIKARRQLFAVGPQRVLGRC